MSVPSSPPPSDDDPPAGLLQSDRRWGTVGLVLVNLAVGLVMAWAGVPVLLARAADVIAFGAVEPPLVWSGEVWRLLSACFVHVGAWHLGLNLWVLWQVGRALERLVELLDVQHLAVAKSHAHRLLDIGGGLVEFIKPVIPVDTKVFTKDAIVEQERLALLLEDLFEFLQ